MKSSLIPSEIFCASVFMTSSLALYTYLWYNRYYNVLPLIGFVMLSSTPPLQKCDFFPTPNLLSLMFKWRIPHSPMQT